MTDGGDEHQRVGDVGGEKRDAERWKTENIVKMRRVTYLLSRDRRSRQNGDRRDGDKETTT